MVMNFNTKNFLYRFFNGLYPWVAKLDNLAGIGHYDVVMLLIKIRLFIVALVLPELVAAHQAAFQQQLYRVIQRGTAYTVVFVFHFDIERLNIKMLLAVVYFLQDCVALRGFPVAFVFKEFREDVFYNILIFIIFHGMGINTCKGKAKFCEVKVLSQRMIYGCTFTPY